jgi:hypothetical protein
VTTGPAPAAPRDSALVTATYWKDRERFELLAQTVDRWVPAEVPHYVFVARHDLPLFREFDTGRRRVVVVEDLVPWWLVKPHWRSPVWLSLRSGLVKNWILQQIVKLSMPAAVSEDVLYHLDSDVFFTGPFDPAGMIADGRAPLYVHAGNHGLLPEHVPWHDAAARALGLPELHDDERNYARTLIPWDRAVILAALDRVEQVHGTPWQQTVAKMWQFSEYTLYGTYAERVLPDPESRLRAYDTELVHEYWLSDPLDERGLLALREATEPQQIAVLIHSKSETPLDLVRSVYADRI